MDYSEYNQKAILDVYKNAHIALQSISDLIPSVNDDEIKSELKEQYEGYEKIIGEISSYMKDGIVCEKPDMEEVKEMILRHARMLIECKGEYTGIREMRKHVAWYTPLT